MEVMFCPKCNNGAFRDLFCRRCGTQMIRGPFRSPTNTKCPKCEAGDIFPEDKFCGTCGAALCFLFVFRSIYFDGCIVIANAEKRAWQVLAVRVYSNYHEHPESSLAQVKEDFNLFAKLEVPGLIRKGE